MSERTGSEFDRRRFLLTSGALGVGGLLAGCSGGESNGSGGTTGGSGGGGNDGGGTTASGASDAVTTTQGTGSSNANQSSGGSSANRGGTFVGATAEDAPTLDPRMNELAWANSFLQYIFSTLYIVPPDGSEPVSHVAKEQPQQQDDATYTIPIKEGITFHDGSELTAEDVAYSFNWILDPDNKSPNRANLQFIDSVEATGEYETRFNLKNPFALFELTLAGMNAGIVPKEIAEEQGTESFGQQPVGSGPFEFVERESAAYFLLERNPEYFLETPNLDRIRMRIIPKPQVQFIELVGGNVDQATVPKNLLGRAENAENIQLGKFPQFDYNGIVFNTMREPFENPKVREAMQYVVDYDALLKASKGELGTRSYGFMPLEVNKAWEFPWQEWKEQYFPAKDLDRARQLLSEAGYDGGIDKTLKMSTLASGKFANMMTIFQNQLNEIGIQAEVQQLTIGRWLSELDSGKFDATIYGWSGGQDPDGFYYYLFRDLRNDEEGMSEDLVGNASAGYLYQSNPESEQLQQLDSNIREARRLQNRDERRQLYVDAAETVQSLYPNIPVFSEQTVEGWNANLKNYENTAFATQPLCNEWSNAHFEQ